ncbi:MAG: ATP-binding cassette domain-containing protein [Chitinophagales bacterium]
METGSNILKIENLTASYGSKSVLNGVNLMLNRGEICCVIGEEGAGKSTLVKAIVKQVHGDGKIYFKERDLENVPTSKMTAAKIDFIAQGGNILKGFTVEEHIRLALSDRNKSEQGIVWKEIEETFPKMIMLKKQIAGRLSGGERMILSMACLLATDTELWILDEPTAGLAPETCNVIGGFLTRMQKERNKTILLTEHNYDFAFRIADSVVVLKDGTLSHKYSKNEFNQINFIETNVYETVIS